MKKIIFVTIATLTALATGCGKNNVTDSDQNQVLPLPRNRIEISMIEELGENSRSFLFSCATEEIYSCCNNVILNQATNNGDKIAVEFNGIDFPDICLTALGPATCRIELNQLESKSYDLEFTDNIKVSGKLIVSPESYKIEFNDTTRVVFKDKKLMRVPEHTIWGRIQYHEADSIAAALEFLDSLVSAGAVKKSFSSGDYFYYQIDENGDIYYSGDYGSRYMESFIFEYSGDTTSVRNIVKQFGQRYPDESNMIYFSVYDDKGHSFLSWMLRRE